MPAGNDQRWAEPETALTRPNVRYPVFPGAKLLDRHAD